MCHDVCSRSWLAVSGNGSFLHGMHFLYFPPFHLYLTLFFLASFFLFRVDLFLPLIGAACVLAA